MLLATLLAPAGTRHATAAGTSPVLMLSAVDVFGASSGERLLTASGAFNFDDLVQTSFPAVGLIVLQGTRFVRFEIDGDVVAGTAASVGDGISPDELSQVLQIGGPASAPARLVHLNRDEVSVVLPSNFVAGTALVLLYAKHDAESFLSPPVAVVLP